MPLDLLTFGTLSRQGPKHIKCMFPTEWFDFMHVESHSQTSGYAELVGSNLATGTSSAVFFAGETENGQLDEKGQNNHKSYSAVLFAVQPKLSRQPKSPK